MLANSSPPCKGDTLLIHCNQKINMQIMATNKKRINISLPKDLQTILEELAERDNVPTATKAVELIKIAVEIDEDEIWDKLASERDTKDTKFISHKEAWS